MASTTFTDYITNVQASWLNDVNTVTYKRTVNYVNVLEYGGTMNDSSASVRTANSAAIIAAAAANKNVYIPPGTFWIDPSVEVPASIQLTGSGRSSTIIKGDGDLFKITSASFGTPVFANLTLVNDVTRGKLFRTAVGSDISRVAFYNVEFLKANYHIYATDVCVDWLFVSCRFNDAATASRCYTAGLYACNEIACYTWFNAIGLDVSDNSSSCNINGVFEFNTSYAIRLTANNASHEIDGWTINCHFEGNGSSTANPDVYLVTSAATRIRSIHFDGSRFSTPDATQTLRVNHSAGGSGNIDRVVFGNGTIVLGTPQLCPDSSIYTIEFGVYFQSTAGRPTQSNFVPVTYHVTGVSNGSGSVQATITPPTGARWAEVRVQGNNYNGSANTHDGRLYGTWRLSGNRVSTDVDVNHSAGANQGWVLSWTGSAIQIANKAAMTNNQSGDTTVVFYG